MPGTSAWKTRMVQICNYSTLIFAGNVTVLLIVSTTTDYWEYKGFDYAHLIKSFKKVNNTMVVRPAATDSYLEIRGRFLNTTKLQKLVQEPKYISPVYIKSFFLDKPDSVNKTLVKVEIFLFLQTMNLFRECDSIEATVRQKVGISLIRKGRCFYFFNNGRPREVLEDYHDIKYLEGAAFSAALLSIIFMCTGVCLGGYGSISKQTRYVMTASFASLFSGLCLTSAIALFNGKAHLVKKIEKSMQTTIPYNGIINASRRHEFGWSFVLAWICVALCFTSSVVWLYKSQYMTDSREPGMRYLRGRNRLHPRVPQNRSPECAQMIASADC